MIKPPKAQSPTGTIVPMGSRIEAVIYDGAGRPAGLPVGQRMDGRLLYGPSGICDSEADLDPGYHLIPRCDSAINAGLRILGVRASPGQDEYQAIGLTRHRYTEDWAVELVPPAGPG